MTQLALIPSSIIDSLPTIVRSELSNCTPQEQDMFLEEYRRKAKSTGIGYLLLLFGIHYAYVGNWGLLLVFIFTCGGCFIWWFIDIFRLPGILRDHNKDVAMEALRNIKLLRR